MLALLGGFLAKSVLMQSPVGGLLKGISPRAWRIIAIAAALLAAVFLHQHYAHKALKTADATGYARAKAEDAEVAKKMAARARQTEATGRDITQKVEVSNVQATSNIRAHARDQRMRISDLQNSRVAGGPLPGLPGAASGGNDHANGSADAAVGGPFLAVPALELVDRAEQCDINTQNLIDLRNWIKLESQAFSGKEKNGGRQ